MDQFDSGQTTLENFADQRMTYRRRDYYVRHKLDELK
jgi:hypothetical protein